MRQAPWAPFLNRQFTDFFSRAGRPRLLREPGRLRLRLRDDLHAIAGWTAWPAPGPVLTSSSTPDVSKNCHRALRGRSVVATAAKRDRGGTGLNRKHRWKWLLTASCSRRRPGADRVGMRQRRQEAARPRRQAAARRARRGKTLRELPHRVRHGHRLPRPGPLVHRAGLGDHVERLPAAARVQARERPGRRDDHSVPRPGLPHGLVRREDVHADACARASSTRTARPSRRATSRYAIERDFKIDSPGVGFFGNIVGANAFAKTKKGHITGIVDERRDREDHDPSDVARGRLREHPRDDLRRARSGRRRRRRTSRRRRSRRPART